MQGIRQGINRMLLMGNLEHALVWLVISLCLCINIFARGATNIIYICIYIYILYKNQLQYSIHQTHHNMWINKWKNTFAQYTRYIILYCTVTVERTKNLFTICLEQKLGQPFVSNM